MAKSSNNLSGITNKISKGRGSAGSARPTSLISESTVRSASAKTLRPSRSLDLTTGSEFAKSTLSSIRFGTAPTQPKAASSSGSEWTNLLRQTASGGVASLLGGGIGIGGLGSLVSSITSLFGGGGKAAAPPPIVPFQLPASQEHTVYLRTANNTAGTANSHYAGSGIYSGSSSANGQPLQYQSSQIAQAVKAALLNSSSLNDVIAEI